MSWCCQPSDDENYNVDADDDCAGVCHDDDDGDGRDNFAVHDVGDSHDDDAYDGDNENYNVDADENYLRT